MEDVSGWTLTAFAILTAAIVMFGAVLNALTAWLAFKTRSEMKTVILATNGLAGKLVEATRLAAFSQGRAEAGEEGREMAKDLLASQKKEGEE